MEKHQMLLRLRRTFGNLPGKPILHATHLLHALDLVHITRVSPSLRFFARIIPIVCIERTRLFSRDDEIIALAMQCDNVYMLSKTFVGCLDVSYVVDTLFPSLMHLDGAWGALSFIANRYLTGHRSGATLQVQTSFFYMMNV